MRVWYAEESRTSSLKFLKTGEAVLTVRLFLNYNKVDKRGKKSP